MEDGEATKALGVECASEAEGCSQKKGRAAQASGRARSWTEESVVPTIPHTSSEFHAEVHAAIGRYVPRENIEFGASVVLASGSK